jgi:hypothetical protein
MITKHPDLFCNIYRLRILKTPRKIQNRNYDCQCLFYRLDVFDMYDWYIYAHQVGIPVPSIHFAANGTPLYTNNMPHTTVCTMHKWLAQ